MTRQKKIRRLAEEICGLVRSGDYWWDRFGICKWHADDVDFRDWTYAGPLLEAIQRGDDERWQAFCRVLFPRSFEYIFETGGLDDWTLSFVSEFRHLTPEKIWMAAIQILEVPECTSQPLKNQTS